MKVTMYRTAMAKITIQRGSLLENAEKTLVVLVTDPLTGNDTSFEGTSVYDVRPDTEPADHSDTWRLDRFVHYHGKIVLEQ